MKITKQKKNDRVAFFNLAKEEYDNMSKKAKQAYQRPEDAPIGTLDELL
jgi:hypothetical protein